MRMKTICMIFLFLFNIMLCGQTLSPIPTPVSKIANTIIVAKSGGDYNTITSAVAAASAGTTILVYPGTYAERVVLWGGISLIGTDKINCRIVKSVQGTGGPVDGWLVVVNQSEVRNLYIENTYAGYSSTAIGVIHGGIISNCIIKSSHKDTVVIRANENPIIIENCDIENTSSCGTGGDTFGIYSAGILADCIIRNCRVKNSGSDSSAVWLGGSDGNTKPQFYNCIFMATSSGNQACVRYDNIGSYHNYPYFYNCQFLDYSTLAPMKLAECWDGSGSITYLQNCVYSEIGDAVQTYNTVLTGTQDLISLKIGGTERIDSSGNVKGATLVSGGNTVADASGRLSSYTTLWKDWAACAGQPAFVDESIWHPAMDDNMTYMHCTTDTKYLLFEIPYEAGTVLTRLRVKWQAEGNNDGVKVRLVKRDESGMNTGWTVVGAQQTTYIDDGTPYDVTGSIYDFTDETMAANYSYSLEVESEKVTSGVKLFSVGVETSKRVY